MDIVILYCNAIKQWLEHSNIQIFFVEIKIIPKSIGSPLMNNLIHTMSGINKMRISKPKRTKNSFEIGDHLSKSPRK